MGLWAQADVIEALRVRLDDTATGKPIYSYQPLLPPPDGTNKIFRIPQTRIQDYPNLTIYRNGIALVHGDDWTLTDSMMGTITINVAPNVTDNLTADFFWVWLTDQECDRHLVRGANELSFSTYHTDPATIVGGEPTDPPGYISDIPNGLKTALILFASMHAAEALANRFATRYNTGFGDQSFSLSDLAKNFQARVESYRDQAIVSRDDYHSGQGFQLDPSIGSVGYRLRDIVPPR